MCSSEISDWALASHGLKWVQSRAMLLRSAIPCFSSSATLDGTRLSGKKELQRNSITDTWRGHLLGNLQERFPDFSRTQDGKGWKGREINAGVDNGKISFLSPPSRVNLDGILHSPLWS